jgi:hypothetical protein
MENENIEDDGVYLSEEEEREAAVAGNAAFMAQAFKTVVKYAEIGVMTTADKIEDENEKKVMIDHGASSIFVFKQLIDVFEKEVEKFGGDLHTQMQEGEESSAKASDSPPE